MSYQPKEISIGPLTGLLKPKYVLISAMLGEDFFPTQGVDVFIDLNTLITNTSGYQKYLNGLPFSKNIEIDIISNLLMTLKHWKDYMKNHDNSRIFLIYNDFEMLPLVEANIVKSYLVPHVNKYQQDRYKQFVYYFQEALKKIKTIIKHLPAIYMIASKKFDSFVIPNILDSYEFRYRVIISGNSLMTSYNYMNNSKMLFTRYRKQGTFQITDPIHIVQSMTSNHEDIMEVFSRNKVLYNTLQLILGDYDRGILGLSAQIGITPFTTRLLRAIEQKEIPTDAKSVESILKVFDSEYHEYIRKNYPLVDIESHTKLIPQSEIEKIKSEMNDKIFDIDALRSISIDGLNLMELL